VTRRVSARTVVAIGAGGALTASMLQFRRWHRHWGATADEVTRALPGDDLIRGPLYQTTRAVTIRAAQETIWAWLIQIGQGRGGFYSFDRLENLAGMTIESADRIVPELQHLTVGDMVPVGTLGGPTVVQMVPGKFMVLHYVMDLLSGKPVERGAPGVKRWLDWTWTFVLDPIDGTSTRLVVRVRAKYAPRLLRPLMAIFLTPTHALMEQAMLRGIKRRAESTISARTEPATIERVESPRSSAA